MHRMHRDTDPSAGFGFTPRHRAPEDPAEHTRNFGAAARAVLGTQVDPEATVRRTRPGPEAMASDDGAYHPPTSFDPQTTRVLRRGGALDPERTGVLPRQTGREAEPTVGFNFNGYRSPETASQPDSTEYPRLPSLPRRVRSVDPVTGLDRISTAAARTGNVTATADVQDRLLRGARLAEHLLRSTQVEPTSGVETVSVPSPSTPEVTKAGALPRRQSRAGSAIAESTLTASAVETQPAVTESGIPVMATRVDDQPAVRSSATKLVGVTRPGPQAPAPHIEQAGFRTWQAADKSVRAGGRDLSLPSDVTQHTAPIPRRLRDEADMAAARRRIDSGIIHIDPLQYRS